MFLSPLNPDNSLSSLTPPSAVDPYGERERRHSESDLHREAWRGLSGRRHLPHPWPEWPEAHGGFTGQTGGSARVHPQAITHRQAQVWHPPLRADKVPGAVGDLYCQGRPDAFLHRALPGSHAAAIVKLMCCDAMKHELILYTEILKVTFILLFVGTKPEESQPCVHAPDKLLAQRPQRQLCPLRQPEHGQQAHALQRAVQAGS